MGALTASRLQTVAVRRASRLSRAIAAELEPVGPVGRLDACRARGSAQRGTRTDCDPVPRARREPRDGTGRARSVGAVSRAHRWRAAGRCSRNRRRRAGQRRGQRTATVSAGPPARAHRRSTLRDRVSRFGGGGLLLHVRLIPGRGYLIPTTNRSELMGGAFKIGRISGIDVRVHWTFFLLLAFFAFIGYQGSGSPLGALTATVMIVALFLCVLLHEFGHSLVAQRLGLEIHSITLLPIGGVSNLESLPEKPVDEVKISVAGPLVSVVLALIFFGVGLLLGAEPRMPTDLFTGIGSVGQFFFYLGYLNIILALFNLIPAFPLDGGRVLRGLLATRLGALRATEIASRVGQLFAFAFFLIGLLGGNFLLALIAVFIFFGANGEAQMVRQRELTRGLSVS